MLPYARLLMAGLYAAALCSCAEPVPVPSRTQARLPMRSAPAASYAGGPAIKATSAATALDAMVYRLAPGDSVRIDVWGEPDLSTKLLIEPNGKINYPFLGQIMAAGRTAPQLAEAIAGGLRNGYLVNPDVRVSVAEYRPIYISGQVLRPGSYPFTLGLRVQEALTLAGGPTQFASLNRLYVQHENAPKNDRLHITLDSQLLPGDTLIVEERTF